VGIGVWVAVVRLHEAVPIDIAMAMRISRQILAFFMGHIMPLQEPFVKIKPFLF
jgi:hypothetical protein